MVDENAPTQRDRATTADETPERRGNDPGLVLDRYQLGAVLGRGGMGEVIAATDLHIERDVAIKRVRSPEPTADDLLRFEREARIQARLDHPAIVPVHELGKDAAGRPYFTMKRLAGTTLHARMQKDRGTIQPMLRALVDACFALAHAHDRGIVHRDIKPANIMLGDYGEVYVLDWGVARVLAAKRTSALSLVADSLGGQTAAGAILGTPGYMAPEQTRGDAVGPAADVYSLGAILFEILAGEPLHGGGDSALVSTLERPTDSPARRNPERDVPVELDQACTAALAEDPGARPTARELAERIQAYLDGDRDLERRRDLAVYHLGIAREALDSSDPGRRRLAVQSAGRALALDPDSAEAQRLVTQLVLVPPRETPTELAAELDGEERAFERVRSYRAAGAYLWVTAWALALPWMTVASWPLAIATIGWALLMALRSIYVARNGRASLVVAMLGNTILALLFSRVTSSFVIMPFVVCGQTIAMAQQAQLRDRRWLLVAWTGATLLLPIALELAGILPTSWRVTDGGLLTWSTVISSRSTYALAILIAGQTVLGMMTASFAFAVAHSRRAALRTTFVQAWHLKQMLPRGASQL